jgi:hypothetical protein
LRVLLRNHSLTVAVLALRLLFQVVDALIGKFKALSNK